ncbi:methionine ABC transporter ATP-binding protein [Brevibacterium jeotgali]|uniref:D-methionine transport system ATP-binding protein n=1 Tax=Brevibacterium jeotgali TaxID=1262550 RepID=A0A2H1L3H9_9MICO|nr:methionine ABC transporter ATP-binding protein [Brevibacterium jeotgali]TWC01706.1 D-methionine transport system ATP-binding protein [Brevibacterium jeotgali]SMY11451.1 D-methionine transport system ATP-binding protein [Brevibacterium jeotgali]
MPESLIEFRDVTRTFGKGEKAVTAVDDVSLHVDRGEIYGIIGFSGAGKSTLIRMVNGLERPTSGSVRVLGHEISSMAESKLPAVRSRIGMVFQQFNLFRSRNVSGNVAYPLKVAGWSRARRRERVEELLEFVGLSDKAEQYPEELSGGQKQRVGIARALAAEPDILLADESTSALDPSTTAEVLSLLRRANEDLGITILAITHEMEVIRSIADRVAVMDRGRIVESGRVYDIFSNPREDRKAGFVGAALKDRPTSEDVQRIRQSTEGRLVTISLQDSTAMSSVLGRAASHGVSFEIVHGGMNTTKNASYGLLTVAVNGPQPSVDGFLAALADAGQVQEVHG